MKGNREFQRTESSETVYSFGGEAPFDGFRCDGREDQPEFTQQGKNIVHHLPNRYRLAYRQAFGGSVRSSKRWR